MAARKGGAGAEARRVTGLVGRRVEVADGQQDTAMWVKACAVLKGELGDALYGSYIAPARLRRGQGGRLVLVTPTGFAADWVRRNCWPRVRAVWDREDPAHRALELSSRQEFEIQEGPESASPEAASGPPPAPSPSPVRLATLDGAPATPVSASAEAAVRGVGQALQARNNFDTFVTGPANEFAWTVARQVASGAAGPFNLVALHGAYGQGKTHLLHAIAHAYAERRPGSKVICLSADHFVNAYVRANMERAIPAFKEELRTAELLLIDDLQTIAGKKGSQEELSHILTALLGEDRRVVTASDRPPQAMTDLDARLRSHLCGGLSCPIEAADGPLRLEIAQAKMRALAGVLGLDGRAKPEVLQLLADRFTVSVRELEGGVATLIARAGARLAQLGVDEALALLRPHLKGGDRRVTVDEIQKAVCEHYALKQADLISPKRTRAVARPRQVAMWLAKSLTTRSYPDIGRRFGGRDHTTVLHGVRTVEKLRGEDPSLASDIETLTRKLRD